MFAGSLEHSADLQMHDADFGGLSGSAADEGWQVASGLATFLGSAKLLGCAEGADSVKCAGSEEREGWGVDEDSAEL